MCGISGFVSERLNQEDLEQITNILAHRGPDSSGYYFNDEKNIGLGHRRLSILDLSDVAKQPMHSHNDRYVIVFNGEIYNFKEIAQKLNINFKTSSDTEVILEAFSNWSTDFIQELNGMFAIAIYDKQDDTLFLFRDRMGIKPLYYYLNNNEIVFASEIKSFQTIGNKLDLEIDNSSISDFLHLGYIPNTKTIYKNVKKLPNGSFGKFTNKELSIKQYWNVDEQFKNKTITNENEAKSLLDNAINQSVKYRLISDVTVGTFLSGGIDSSLVTAVASKNHNGKLNTFSIGFKEAKYNESEHAKAVAKHLGTNHHEFILSEQDALEQLEQIIDGYDQPFADSSALPTYLVSKMAKQHATVCLSGDGGDELFMGYGAYTWRKRLSNPLIWNLRKPLATGLKLTSKHSFKRGADVLDSPKKDIESHIFSQEQYLFSQKELETLLLNQRNDVEKFSYSTIRELTPIEQQSLYDIKNYLKDDLLVKVDIASMMNSLEVRVPLLDHNIVSLAVNIDEKLKFHPNGTQKYILKEVLFNYIPKEFFDRPKWGFSIPLEKWLQNELSYLIEKYLNIDIIESLGILSFPIVNSYISRFKKGETYLYNRIWAMIVLNKFLIKTNSSSGIQQTS